MTDPMDFRIGAFNPQISRNTTIAWRFTPSTPDALDDFTFALDADDALVASITVDGDDLLLTVTAGPVLKVHGYPLAVTANGQDFLTGAVYVSTTGTASPSPSTEIVARLPGVETPITLEVLVVGGLGQVVTIVDGDNIDVDDTDPANPVVSVTPGAFEDAGTAAGLVATEAGTRTAADVALDGRLDIIEGLGPLATAASVTAEAGTRAAADVALDGRLDTIEALGPLATVAGLAAEASTRGAADTTLQANITAEAALARNADNLTGGTVAEPRISALLTRDTELVNAVAAEAAARDAAIALAIANLIGSAPGLLDTLQELADALGDDPNFAATITTALAGKQPIDSDLTAIAALTSTAYGRSFLELANAGAGRTLLGLGTAATQATGAFDAAGSAAAAQAASQPLDSDLTAVAALTTTSFGRALLELANAAALRGAAALGTAAVVDTGTGAANVPTITQADARYEPLTSVVTKTTTYTALDRETVLASAAGGAWVLTLPAVALNKRVTVKKTDSSVNAITVTPASGTIDGAATHPITLQYASRDFVSDGTNWFVV